MAQRPSVRLLSATPSPPSPPQHAAFVPRSRAKVTPSLLSSNPDFFEQLQKEEKENKPPKLKRLQFSETGKGETPSSIRRELTSPLRREVLAVKQEIPCSPTKLNMVATLVRQMTLQDALDQLRYSPKITSVYMMELLHQGEKMAELEHDLKREELYVAVAQVGKGQYEKRTNPHGKGRFGIRHVKKCHLFIILRELANENVQKYKLVRRKLLKDRQRPWIRIRPGTTVRPRMQSATGTGERRRHHRREKKQVNEG